MKRTQPMSWTTREDQFENQLARVADYVNQKLRESGGGEFQIQDYLHSDFRLAIRKLLDLNQVKQGKELEDLRYQVEVYKNSCPICGNRYEPKG